MIEERRDIRRFRADPIPPELLWRVLEAAHRAPSVGLMQPWRFILIESRETRTAVRALAARERLRQAPRFGPRRRHFLDQKVEGILEAPLGICVCCDRGRPGEEVLGRATIVESDLYSTACAIQNLWLTARAEGLGVGWVSFYRPADMRALLGIPAGVEPMAYLCLGFPDERPTRPGLESAGWAVRRSLSEVVMRERWRPAAGPSATGNHVAVAEDVCAKVDPHPRIAALVHAVRPVQAGDALAARDRADELVKPAGSLGDLERLVERWAAASGAPPPAPLCAAILVCAADHGIADHRPSLFGRHVSAQVAAAAARGETAIAVIARAGGHRLLIADLGLSGPRVPGVRDRRVASGSADISVGPALQPDELEEAVLSGAELAAEALEGRHCLVLGEIGIGNTTVAGALLAGLTGCDLGVAVGRGTGLDAEGVERKRGLIAQALGANAVDASAPLEVLRRLGGLEFAALVGAALGAAARRRPIILDGFATTVAALAACRLCPSVRDYLFAGHLSPEPGHGVALTELGLEPLLDLGMRLGEASGGALSLPLIEAAGRLHREMGTFESTGVEAIRVDG